MRALSLPSVSISLSEMKMSRIGKATGETGRSVGGGFYFPPANGSVGGYFWVKSGKKAILMCGKIKRRPNKSF